MARAHLRVTGTYAILEVSAATWQDVFDRLIGARDRSQMSDYADEYLDTDRVFGDLIVLGQIALAKERT